jgi:hypothetical protein
MTRLMNLGHIRALLHTYEEKRAQWESLSAKESGMTSRQVNTPKWHHAISDAEEARIDALIALEDALEQAAIDRYSPLVCLALLDANDPELVAARSYRRKWTALRFITRRCPKCKGVAPGCKDCQELFRKLEEGPLTVEDFERMAAEIAAQEGGAS